MFSRSSSLQISRTGWLAYGADIWPAPPAPPRELTTPARRLKLHCSWHVAEHTPKLRPQVSTFKPPIARSPLGPESPPLHLAYSPPHWAAQPSAQPQAAAQAWVHTPLMVSHKLPKISVKSHCPFWMAH